MSILVKPEPHEPLDQGDLLGKLNLYWSDKDGNVTANQGMGLVLSRPCVAVRRAVVQVAVVGVAKLEVTALLRDGASLDRVRRRMFAVRDGDGQPDVFYLGHLPGETNRFAAKLDHIVSVEVPTDNAERADWISARRVARLADAFRRDLHTRVFMSIARQGFDDLDWYTDEDLDLLVKHGSSLAHKAQADLETWEAQADAARADGDGGRASGLEKNNIPKAKTALSECRDELAPFEAELQRRRQAAAPAETSPEAPSRFRPSAQD